MQASVGLMRQILTKLPQGVCRKNGSRLHIGLYKHTKRTLLFRQLHTSQRQPSEMDPNGMTSYPGPAPVDGHADPELVGLSIRAIDMVSENPKYYKYFTQSMRNKYDPETNPEGVVPFGLAENKIAIELLLPQLEASSSRPEEKRIYSYGKMSGEDEFRKSLKKFLERHFHPLHELDVNTLFVTNGVTTILENLAFALAQPGEYIMIPRPYYYRLFFDFYERAGVLTLPFDQPLPSESSDNRYGLDVAALEATFNKATEEGKVVRAIHITNPSNPTGDMYTAEELTQLLDFAHKHKLHVLANELYGLSVCEPGATFTSILSLPHPDPERVHFLWGFSKDLGLSGIRVSTMYTRHPGLVRYFTQTAIYIRPTGVSQRRLKPIIDDLDTFDQTVLPELRRRLYARHQNVKEVIEGCGGRVHPSPASVFRWMDFSSFMPTPDWDGEHQLFLRLLSGGVHLVEGRISGHRTPGWFRMVAAMEDSVHEEGMRRIVKCLTEIRAEKQQQQQQ